MTIFYSPHEPDPWRGFEPPVKHEFKRGKMTQHQYRQVMKAYYKTLYEAKENSLPIANPEVIKPVFWEEEKDVEYTWKGSAVIRDNKIYLKLTSQDEAPNSTDYSENLE